MEKRQSSAALMPWVQVILSVALFSALRLLLSLKFRGEAHFSTGELIRTFAQGSFLDLFVALCFSLPALIYVALVPGAWLVKKFPIRMLFLFFGFYWALQTFLGFAEYYFFEEFRSRFNTVAVDYLLYPHEVFINIWDTYPVATVLAISLFGAGLFLFFQWKLAVRFSRLNIPFSPRRHGLGLILFTIGLWSIIPHSLPHFSRERVVNEIASNGAFSFCHAFLTRNLDYAAFYKTLQAGEAYQRATALLPGTNHPGLSLQRTIPADRPARMLNVVLFLEESLGSEFWGSLGRPDTLTPEMDRLAAREGLLFTNIYASGNRTVRGFEGVLSSFPPLPGDSIVKRDRSKNVETLARILKRRGYDTLFLYGGRGVFDGMRSFALDNGYDRFIEQKHFEHPVFTTIWGVSDEDLFQRSLVEIRALAAKGKPFFTTILSVSNHKPFTYPEGRIPEDPKKRQRNHAVKYSDYCLGQFFKASSAEPFYTNTIFVVVADHGARVYGSQKIPIHSYEIPLLIAGPAVVKSPSRPGQLGCSLDVSPTILGLLGGSYETIFFGQDLLAPGFSKGRALLNHNRDIGMFTEDRLVVLGINKTVEFYQGNPKVEEMRNAAPDVLALRVERDTEAMFQTADELYMSRRYRVIPEIVSSDKPPNSSIAH